MWPRFETCWGLVLSWSGWEAAEVLSHCSATVLYFCTNLFLLIWLVYLLASPQAGVAFSQQDFWFSFNRLLCGGNVKCLVSLWRQGKNIVKKLMVLFLFSPKQSEWNSQTDLCNFAVSFACLGCSHYNLTEEPGFEICVYGFVLEWILM